MSADVAACGRLAVALARAAEVDDAVGLQVWNDASPDEQNGAVLILATWMATVRPLVGVTWEQLIDGFESVDRERRREGE